MSQICSYSVKKRYIVFVVFFISSLFCKASHRPLVYMLNSYITTVTVKILKFGTPQTIAIIVLKIEKFDVTLH